MRKFKKNECKVLEHSRILPRGAYTALLPEGECESLLILYDTPLEKIKARVVEVIYALITTCSVDRLSKYYVESRVVLLKLRYLLGEYNYLNEAIFAGI